MYHSPMDLQKLLDEISSALREQADRLDHYRLSLTASGGTGPLVSVQPNEQYAPELNKMAVELQKAHQLNEKLAEQLANARHSNLAA